MLLPLVTHKCALRENAQSASEKTHDLSCGEVRSSCQRSKSFFTSECLRFVFADFWCLEVSQKRRGIFFWCTKELERFKAHNGATPGKLKKQ